MPCNGPPDDHGADRCGRPVWRCGLCFGHSKQARRGRTLRPLAGKIPPFDHVLEMGSAWLEADAEDDRAYRAAVERFRRAVEAWMTAEGWQRPTDQVPRPCEPGPEPRAALAS